MPAGSDPLALVRDDLRDFAGYRSARTERNEGSVWLNANESAWANPADAASTLRRYPQPQPPDLRAALAALYGCQPAQLLAGRGSDECIDLLLRAVCRPGLDAVVTTPPTFGMYAVCARLHGCRLLEVPLLDRGGRMDVDFAVVADTAERSGAKLVMLCSPGNPSGTALPVQQIEALAWRLDGRALVVVDEAYGEYSDEPSSVALLERLRNVVVLRTLSKAHALAAARIGSVIADPALITVLQRCQAPYPLPQPCVDVALSALSAPAQAQTGDRVVQATRERECLQDALAGLSCVRAVYASQANFVLVRFADAQRALEALLAAGIVVRDMRAQPRLGDALRISLGTPEQNSAVLDTLAGLA
ncbi:histidinol-phosphate transaminase [Montanilutibacter psychrotolerans]|uniref:Histidinol-phosphate aminotransferase n=1 Tax=Montanilutibacter psychrotolerans TaxID=1327343 RepID=A0A3M8T512_9GAMM|nr:histidinol-phosphate transaminase [Lysobacter psychrotolerans]RNF86564.1 histidinol-phosphate transaminase [Lysobacter psychrotolerans]